MNDRTRALAILRQARDILAQRLTDRVLEMHEELLDDAHGHTYCGEIDSLYEQIAVRLNHVSVMISALPTDELHVPCSALPAHPLLSHSESGPRSQTPLFQTDTAQATGRDMQGTAAFIEQAPAAYEATALTAPVTFELFVRQIADGDQELAVRSLAILFGIDEKLGRRCAAVFRARYLASPAVLGKAMQLRRELQYGDYGKSRELLEECFGLQGADLMNVMQTLRARLVGLNEAM